VSGWFVTNVAETPWWRHDEFGAGCNFEPEDDRFDQFGINIQVLWPGQPNCMYHGEAAQEDFLVLHGQCLLLVEGEERPLKAWDFVHCPPGAEHVFVGAGDGPCAILMVGMRGDEVDQLLYPVNETARKHGASVEQETKDPREAYARFGKEEEAPLPDIGLPWQ
jgi:uncharacterized cupin superfamily protein